MRSAARTAHVRAGHSTEERHMIFVNLPTTDLDAAKAFYVALGAEINPMFTDENAAGIVWDANTHFMVHTDGPEAYVAEHGAGPDPVPGS